MQHVLMLGAGHTPLRRRLQIPTSEPDSETRWTSLDFNPECRPDILLDLNTIEQGARIPVDDGTFDEIHAYEVMEHYGRQGDYKGFFCGFRELWRVLKPGGHLVGTSPNWDNRWAWGDPGHTRIIQPETFCYLERANYSEYLGKTAMTDYRSYVDPYWWILRHNEVRGDHFVYCLEKDK